MRYWTVCLYPNCASLDKVIANRLTLHLFLVQRMKLVATQKLITIERGVLWRFE